MKNIAKLFYRVSLILLVIIVGFGMQHSNAQDIHFSQFMSAPFNLNPASTGYYDGLIRGVGNYRRQWNAVTIPYQTIGIGADFKNLFNARTIAGGLFFFNDRTGDSRLTTNIVNASLSKTFMMDSKGNEGITIGITSGITYRSVNYDDLTFEDQYVNQSFDANIKTGEFFTNTSKLNPNFNLGIAWFKHYNSRKKLYTGTSLFNINRPDQSFFDTEKIVLDRRLNVHASYQTKLSTKMDIIPAALVSLQGIYTSITLGTSFKYILNSKPVLNRAAYVGFWTRGGDAGWVTLGMDYGNWYGGVSYDINYSQLYRASNTRGGIEVAVIYTVKNLIAKRKRYLSCPDFL